MRERGPPACLLTGLADEVVLAVEEAAAAAGGEAASLEDGAEAADAEGERVHQLRGQEAGLVPDGRLQHARHHEQQHEVQQQEQQLQPHLARPPAAPGEARSEGGRLRRVGLGGAGTGRGGGLLAAAFLLLLLLALPWRPRGSWRRPCPAEPQQEQRRRRPPETQQVTSAARGGGGGPPGQRQKSSTSSAARPVDPLPNWAPPALRRARRGKGGSYLPPPTCLPHSSA